MKAQAKLIKYHKSHPCKSGPIQSVMPRNESVFLWTLLSTCLIYNSLCVCLLVFNRWTCVVNIFAQFNPEKIWFLNRENYYTIFFAFPFTFTVRGNERRLIDCAPCESFSHFYIENLPKWAPCLTNYKNTNKLLAYTISKVHYRILNFAIKILPAIWSAATIHPLDMIDFKRHRI